MKKTRVDAKKNKAKIIKEVLENPLQSMQEIAEKTWLWKTTVHEHIKELPTNANKDERIVWLCDTDFNIVKLWQEEIQRRLQKKEELEKMRTFEIAQTIEKSEKRYMIFKGDMTDKHWGLNGANILLDIQNGVINRDNAYIALKESKNQ